MWMFLDQNFVLISHHFVCATSFHPTLLTDNTSVVFFKSDSTDYATEFIVTFVKITVCNQFIIIKS